MCPFLLPEGLELRELVLLSPASPSSDFSSREPCPAATLLGQAPVTESFVAACLPFRVLILVGNCIWTSVNIQLMFLPPACKFHDKRDPGPAPSSVCMSLAQDLSPRQVHIKDRMNEHMHGLGGGVSSRAGGWGVDEE